MADFQLAAAQEIQLVHTSDQEGDGFNPCLLCA
jgi:hypothetical protein